MKLFELIRMRFRRKESEGLRFNFGNTIFRLDRRSSLSFSGIGSRMRVDRNPNSWKRAKGAFILRPDREPNPHIVISGMSGFGKSTLFKSMLMDIHASGLACIIFDAHDEHSSLVSSLGGYVHESSSSGINILSLDGSSVSERISEITSLFRKVYNLGYIQTTKLGECLWYTYRRYGARGGNDRLLNTEPKISDLLYEIKVFIGNAKGAGERNSLLHLRDRISLLNSPSFNSNKVSASGLGNGIHSFSLSSIRGKEQQVIYIEELLRRLYSVMKSMPKDKGVRQYLMMDEAQFLISKSSSSGDIVTGFIEEGRKYGIGAIIVTHSSATLSRQIIANASTFVSFYAREPAEVAFASKVMAHDASSEYAVRSKLSMLKKNEALVVSANERSPRVVSTAMLHGRTIESSKEKPRIPQLNSPILIERLGEITGMQRDKILGLVDSGELQSFGYPSGTPNELWLMHERGNLSIEHEVMVGKLLSYLKLAGLRCFIHDRSNGPDIVAYSNGIKVAVEYETGRKDIERSKEMLASRKNEYGAIVVVVNDGSFALYAQQIKDCKLVGASDANTIAETIKSITVKSR